MKSPHQNPLFLYIPGFGGGETSTTYTTLKPKLDIKCLKYENDNPVLAEAQLEKQLDKYLLQNPNIILIGNSLGGYWTNYFAQKKQLPCFLINPSIYPGQSLKKYCIADEQLARFKPSTNNPVNRIVFLGKKDEVINYQLAVDFFEGKYEVILTDDFHRFRSYDLLMSKINEFLESYSNQ